jgi:hypothetical protein
MERRSEEVLRLTVKFVVVDLVKAISRCVDSQKERLTVSLVLGIG